MKPIKHIICNLFVLTYCLTFNAQTVDLKGKVIASAELGNIHVLNISSKYNTITNSTGDFDIPARHNDTILISSIQYTPHTLIVNQTHIDMKFVTVTLSDRINELDEVVVGTILTGNLISDIENSDVKRDINFYDVGIPGYVGKRKTQIERKLYEADAGKYVYYFGIVAVINIHKVLNRISGRTKKIKKGVRLQNQDNCMNKAKSEFAELLFGEHEIEDHLIYDFFYFVSDAPEFMTICESNNSMQMYEFLIQKLSDYNDASED